jgi:hypothetical protein
VAETDDTKASKGTVATNEELIEENPVVPAGYVPGNTATAGGQAVVDGEIVTFDAEGNEVARGQSALGEGIEDPKRVD